MKKTVDFDKWYYDGQCPVCGQEIYWSEFDGSYYASCCNQKLWLRLTKGKLEIQEMN